MFAERGIDTLKTTAKTTTDLPPIVVDTREQRPYDFGPQVETVRRALPSGDYSLEGLEERVAIERKGLGDILHCIGGDRERFERELERLRGYEYAALVIEADWRDLAKGPRTRTPGRRTLHPNSILGSLTAWSVRYSIPIFTAGNWTMGREITYRLLRHFHRYSTTPGGVEVAP